MPSSVFWSVGSVALATLITPTVANGSGSQYQLIEAWQGEKFLDYFKFYTGSDPTNGYVTYANQSYAESTGLIEIKSSGSFYMGVDYKTTLSPEGPGRDSVRIESKEYYDEGLYIIDLQHMPGSVCGTWPAFWSVGPDWPNDGEIDIIEGVNKHEANEIVLHTSGSCALSGDNEMTGTMTSSECGEASGTVGCVVKGQKGTSGAPFNKQGGGVYAMEWADKFIKIWHFPRGSVPESISNGKPDTSSFGTPMAHLQGTCDFGERFKSQKFILDTTFCGDWAGGVFGDSGCPVSDPSNPIQSCVNYVAQNPAAFKEAYWEINYIKLYQTGTERATASAAVQGGTATAAAQGETATATVQAETTTAAVTQAATTAQPVTSAVQSETTSADTSVVSASVAESPKAHTSTANADATTVQTAASAATEGASADDNDDDNDDGSDVILQTVTITSTTTVCGATKSQGSIKTLGGETAVSPASSAVESGATPIALVPTGQPGQSQPAEHTVISGTAVATGASPQSPAATTHVPQGTAVATEASPQSPAAATDVSPQGTAVATGETSDDTPLPTVESPAGTPVATEASPESSSVEATPVAQQPQESPAGQSSADAVAATPVASAASEPAPSNPATPTESEKSSGEPAPTSVAPTTAIATSPSNSPTPSSSHAHSSSRVSSSSRISTTTSATHTTSSATQETTSAAEQTSGASTGTSPVSPVFTAGASKSMGASSMAGLLCGLAMALLA